MIFQIVKFFKNMFSNSDYFISSSELQRVSDEIIIDVRTPQEITQTGVIANATIKDFRDDDFHTYISKLSPDEDYIVYCKAGGRSAKAAQQMRQLGLKVKDYSPGMDGWLKSALPTIKVNS